MSPLTSVLGAAAALLLVGTSDQGASPAVQTAKPVFKTRAEAFQWFDSLGFDAVLHGQFGQVQDWSTDDDGRKDWVTTAYGFLVQSQPLTVTDTKTITLTHPSHVSIFPADKTEFTPLDLDTWIKKELPEMKVVPRDEPFDRGDADHPQFTDVDLFVLARAAEARGLTKDADALYEKLENDPQSWKFGATSATDSVLAGIPGAERAELMAQLGDPKTPWSETLQGFEHYVAHFSYLPDIALERDDVDVLRQMVAEPPLPTQEEVNSLPPKQKIGALIRMLETQNGGQMKTPGGPDIFIDQRDKLSPATQLATIGYAAVPQLLDALEDRRFSRTTYRTGRTPNDVDGVLRVNSVVLQVLDKIASENIPLKFRNRGMRNRQTVADDLEEAKDIEQSCRVWWANAQGHGEEDNVIKSVVRGDQNSIASATRLIQLDPANALKPIVKGIQASDPNYVTPQLIGTLDKLNSKSKDEILRHEMGAGETLRVRMAAARVLAPDDPDAATAAMIKEARKGGLIDNETGMGDQASDGLIQFLYGSGDPKAIAVLQEALPKLGVGARSSVIDDAEYAAPRNDCNCGFRRTDSLPGFFQAVERLLAGELSDRARIYALSGSYKGVSYENPPLSDMAAETLSSLWPKEYNFAVLPTASAMERQRIANLNVWRKKNSLPLLALPSEGSPFTGPKNWVREVSVSGADAHLFPALVGHVKQLQGSPLDSSKIQSLIDTSSSWPNKLKTWRFTAERDADSKGFTILFEVNREVGHGAGWGADTSVVVDGTRLTGAGMAGDSVRSMLGDEFMSAVRKALAATSKQAVQISFAISYDTNPPELLPPLPHRRAGG